MPTGKGSRGRSRRKHLLAALDGRSPLVLGDAGARADNGLSTELREHGGQGVTALGPSELRESGDQGGLVRRGGSLRRSSSGRGGRSSVGGGRSSVGGGRGRRGGRDHGRRHVGARQRGRR